ncbi:MAG TPA: 6-phosphofructokinase, partial [Actinomycetota bacterium]|nr:6-phosphofructokinase [Actinomycetota bacterium]
MRIGMLTGGGDAPGLNAVIRAVVRKATDIYGDVVIGFRNGWKGTIDGEADTLTAESVKGLLPRGGTILGSSRTNPFKVTDGVTKIEHTLKSLKLDALIAIGGEDTLGVASKLSEQGVNVVGVPKTIDNDLSGTDFTFGFNTAVEIATEALDRLHTTAESHQRVMVVELMGRHAGWISTYAGIASGADVILIPEHPFDLEEVCAHITRRHQRGRTFSIVVVAEGATPKEGTWETQTQELDQFGHVRLGGIANALAPEIEKRTGFETRVTILGHVQRGGTPSAFDRVLATRFGIAAIDAVHDRDFGKMVA